MHRTIRSTSPLCGLGRRAGRRRHVLPLRPRHHSPLAPIGNVRVGPDGDITHNEIHRLAASGDRELLVLELKARGVAVTTWEGLCAPLQDFEDWRSVITRAQLAHVGI